MEEICPLPLSADHRGDDLPSAEEGVIEIGLCFGGAIAAGAYSAGVADFFLEAFEEWEKAKASGAAVPNHTTRIGGMSGASAGGMIAATVASGLVGGPWRPVRSLPEKGRPAGNALFDPWVPGIGFEDLLSSDDLEAGQAPHSILNGKVLEKLSRASIVQAPLGAGLRPYASESLRILLTVSNLRGVDYSADLKGESGRPHGMRTARDHMRFRLRSSGDSGRGLDRSFPDERVLDFNQREWEQLRVAALASGAFPGFLPARELQRPYSDYAQRVVFSDTTVPGQGGGCAWRVAAPEPVEEDPFRFLAVDGGAFDNEPIELLRRTLLGRFTGEPTSSVEISRPIVLIDPFAEMARAPGEAAMNPKILSVLGAFGSAMLREARFTPEDLARAHSAHARSRWLVAPVRDDGALQDSHLATGFLGGFGGFFAQATREQDFFLGRRNAQAFLRWHFSLPRDHPLFKPWRDDPSRQRQLEPEHLSEGLWPILPLCGTAREECRLLPYTAPNFERDRIGELFDRRFKRLWNSFLMSQEVNWLGRTWLGPVRRTLQPKLKAILMEALSAAERAR